MRVGRILLGILVCAQWASPQASAADTVTLTDGIGGDNAFELSMADSVTQGSVPATITSTVAVRASNSPRFAFSQVRADEDHPSGMPLPTNVTMSVSLGGTDVTNGGLTLKASTPTQLTLTFAGIDAIGSYSADLLVAQGGAFVPRATIAFRRYPAPNLQILEAQDGVIVSRPAAKDGIRTGKGTATLTIKGANLGTARVVSLNVPTPASADGLGPTSFGPVPSLPVEIVGQNSNVIEIPYELAESGDYEAAVDLSYNGVSHPFTLKISWPAPTPEVEVVSIQGASGDIRACPARSPSPSSTEPTPTKPPCDNAAVWLLLHESHGRTATLNLPALQSVVRKAGTALEEWPQGDVIVGLECSTTGEAASVSPEGIACGGATLNADQLTLAPGSDARLRVGLVESFEPGEYTIRLAVTSPGGARITSEGTVFLRQPAWVAAAFLLIGCGLGYAIRRWLGVDRKRLVSIRRTKELAGRVALAKDDSKTLPEERATLDQLLSRIGVVLEEVTRGESSTIDADIDDVRARVEAIGGWLKLRREIARVPLDVAEPYRAQVQAVEDRLTSPERLTTDQVAGLSTGATIRGLHDAAGKDVRDRVAAVLAIRVGLNTVRKGQFDETVAPLLERVRARAAEGAWLDARHHVAQAETTAVAIRDKAGDNDVFINRGFAEFSGVVEPGMPKAAKVNWAKEVRDLDQRINFGDMVVLLLITMFAVVSGLAFLWVTNPTWGGWASWVAAIVWAAGLQETAAASFTGVLGLRAKLSATGA